MSYENKGTTSVVVIVTMAPDRSGNFVIEAGADPATTIEAALAYLNTFGGGTLITKGAGQTWTCQTTIDIPGPNITWMSDWSLTFTLANGVDDNLIYGTGRDNITLIGIRGDGNKANQTTGVGAISDGIRLVLGTHNKILNCWFEDFSRYGIGIVGSGVQDVDIEVAGNTCISCGWNGITVGTAGVATTSSRIWIHNNYITHSSDVGISSYAGYVEISDNIVTDMDGTDGSGGGAGGQVCYGVEGDATRRPVGVRFSNNTGLDSASGVIFYEGEDHVFSDGHLENMSAYGVQFQNGTVNCEVSNTTIKECVSPIWVARNTSEDARHTIEDCNIYNETTSLTNWTAMITCRANGTIVKGNEIWSGTSQIQIYGAIDINGADETPILDVEFIDNTVYGFDGANVMVVYVRNNADGTIIKDNYIHDCTEGIEIAAASENDTVTLDNRFDNVTTILTDNGTDTILHTREWLVTYGAGGISLTGDVPVATITNGQAAGVGFETPLGLQQLVRAKLKVLPNATQAAADWDLASDYGTVGEAPNTHGEADAATTYNVTNNQWYDIELIALGFFANLGARDRGGITLTVSTAGHDISVFSLLFEYV